MAPVALAFTPQECILAAVAYLLFKHVIADFFLQTRYQWSNKGRYLHPGGVLHALIHLLLSAPVLLILPPSTVNYGLTVLVAEFLVHYHCDWLKETMVKSAGWTHLDNAFWRAMGVDQFVHGMTYVAMVKALA